MSWLWRMLLVVTVVLVPGAFALLVAYIATRTIRERWQLAQVQAQTSGTPVSLRAVVTAVELKDLVRQARATL